MKNKENKDSQGTVDQSGENHQVPRHVKILSNKYFKFGVVIFLYLLWTLWVGSWWLLLGVPVIFDIYVTKKVNWAFWKKRKGPNSKVVEWIDALIFAVIAVTLINIFIFQNYKIPTGSMEKTLQIGDHLYVSKLKYGPKLPNTPLSFPFAQHTMPLTQNTKSYVEWIKWPYKRLKGFTDIKRDDIVVFNFPEGDTVIVMHQSESYHALVRRKAKSLEESDMNLGRGEHPYEYYADQARKWLMDNFEITVRPVDKRDNYIKRCVGLPGDTLKIVNAQIYVNGVPQERFEKIQYRYAVQTDGSRINSKTLERLDIYQDDVRLLANGIFDIPLVDTNVEKVKKLANVQSVELLSRPEGIYDPEVFPHDGRYPWNADNFGPMWIPQKGVTIKIDTSNISLYERIISAYEGNELKIKDGDIYINGTKTDNYTFRMDYYWMMGDNRHDSLDSRFWGFVPEDHIVGAPRFVWLSLNKEKSFPFNIRLNRMFRPAGR
ncbi:MAG: signal peptidase I [Bacteroidales bacterium]|jgi:signal peptidase I|nr:signal peptidase I [Bacteroidales bacterium]